MSETPEIPTPAPPSNADIARARVAELRALYAALVALVKRTIAAEEPVTKASTAKTLTYLKDLQAAHVMTLRAEEDCHDKFDPDTREDAQDTDAIRRDIGRALDRIRDADSAGDVSDGVVGE